MTDAMLEFIDQLIKSLSQLNDSDEDLLSPMARYTLHRNELHLIETIRAELSSKKQSGDLQWLVGLGQQLKSLDCTLGASSTEGWVLTTPVGYISY